MYYGLGNKNIDKLIRAFFEHPYNADRWGVISGCTFFSDEYVQLPQWAASLNYHFDSSKMEEYIYRCLCHVPIKMFLVYDDIFDVTIPTTHRNFVCLNCGCPHSLHNMGIFLMVSTSNR